MTIKFTKLSVLLPTAIGLLLDAAFFTLGYTQDAPGVCAIGIALAFGFSMLGVSNAGVIKKGLFAPTLLFCYALGVTILNTSLLLNGEFEEYPGFAVIGFVLGAIQIAVGAALLHGREKNQTEGD
ncbi:hypothetical protein FACS1894188_13570 [Clostridia bacterium]|nr:hypothetical protein FACS1894188_13570 [Clostridia bacterium]